MNDIILVCIVLLILTILNINLVLRVRMLEKTFAEILSGEMLREFSEEIRKRFKNEDNLSDKIEPISQETLDELNTRFENIAKQARELNELLNKDK